MKSLALIAALINIHCGDVTGPTLPPNIDVSVEQNQNVNINPAPSPSPEANCEPTQVTVATANGLASIELNNPTTIVASAVFEAASCRVQTVTFASIPNTCTFSNPAGTEITARCNTSGDVTIRATINDVAGESTFVVG